MVPPVSVWPSIEVMSAHPVDIGDADRGVVREGRGAGDADLPVMVEPRIPLDRRGSEDCSDRAPGRLRDGRCSARYRCRSRRGGPLGLPMDARARIGAPPWKKTEKTWACAAVPVSVAGFDFAVKSGTRYSSISMVVCRHTDCRCGCIAVCTGPAPHSREFARTASNAPSAERVPSLPRSPCRRRPE